MKHTIRCRGFRAISKGSLVGFAVIHIAELRLTVHDVALHRTGVTRWAQLPAKPMLRDGRHGADEATGKPQYVLILEFEGRETPFRPPSGAPWWSSTPRSSRRRRRHDRLPDPDAGGGAPSIAWRRLQPAAAKRQGAGH
jgi:hypothetical protein